MHSLFYGFIFGWFQRAAFAKFPDLKLFALTNVGNVDTREKLVKHFGALDAKSLREIACYLNLIPDQLQSPFDWHRVDDNFLRELLVNYFMICVHITCIYTPFDCGNKTNISFWWIRFHVTNGAYHNWMLWTKCHCIRRTTLFGTKILCRRNIFREKVV